MTAKQKIIVSGVASLTQENYRLCEALRQTEQIAQEVISILADDHNSGAGCLFAGAGGEDLGCFACLAQDKLGDITVEALMPKSDGTLVIKKGN